MKPADIGAIERELASGGFAWDRKPAEPISFEGVKKPKRYPPTAKQRAQRKAAQVRQRQKWLRYGIVKPKDDAERAWLEANK